MTRARVEAFSDGVFAIAITLLVLDIPVPHVARGQLGDASFQLVTLANMIPFFDELARVLGRGGWALFSFSVGPETPIWVPPERLQAELSHRGFSDFAEFQAGAGTALLARKKEPV